MGRVTRDTQVSGMGVTGDQPGNIGAVCLRSGRQPSHLAKLVDACSDSVREAYSVEERQVSRIGAHQRSIAAASEPRALRLEPGSRAPQAAGYYFLQRLIGNLPGPLKIGRAEPGE